MKESSGMFSGQAMRVIGVDVGGTFVKGGVVDPAGVVLRQRVASSRERGPEAVVDAVMGTVDGLLAGAAGQGQEVDAVGLAALGIIDEREGMARRSVAVGWRDVPLRELVARRTGLPVVLGHDVRTAAVAEATLGAGRGHSDVLFVPVGTGLAAAHVVDGRVASGASWRAGEIGQLPAVGVSGEGTTLERVASASALARRYEHATGRAAMSVDAAAVVEAARGSDAVASRVLDDMLRRLAEMLAIVVTFADPSVVIIGGGLSLAGDAVLDPLGDRVASALGWREPPPVVAARFGDESGWVGAALLAWRRAGHPDDRFPSAAWP